MFAFLLKPLVRLVKGCVAFIQDRVDAWTTLASSAPVVGAISDMVRTKPELVAENALLRQQLVVLQRQVKRPRFRRWDRLVLLWLDNKVRTWKSTLLILQPDTLLCWHRDGFRRSWRANSMPGHPQATMASETIALIKQMAAENRTWGAERIRGELLKLGLRVAKRTIQKYMCQACVPRPTCHTWRTFLHNHAADIWACDFLPVTDLLFRQVYAFFIVELGWRRVVHVGVTRSPNEAWVAQQLREATPFGTAPKYLFRLKIRQPARASHRPFATPFC